METRTAWLWVPLRASLLLPLCALLGSLCVACDFGKVAANSAAKIGRRARPAIEAHWDYELMVAALPGAIVQSEGLLAVSPENDLIMLGLAQSYVAYAGAYLADEAEIADDAGDLPQADHLRQRAQLMCIRARNLALAAMRTQDEELDVVLAASGFGPSRTRVAEQEWQALLHAAGHRDANAILTGKPELLSRHLAAHYDRERIEGLAVTAAAWGLAIALSGGDPERMTEVDLARALIHHAAEVAPEYSHAAPLSALAAMDASLPPAFGGDLNRAKETFERALSLSGRRSHLVHVAYAKTYAVNAQDRPLYLSLLREVVSAGDAGNDVRLMNKVARRRAVRYLAKVDELF